MTDSLFECTCLSLNSVKTCARGWAPILMLRLEAPRSFIAKHFSQTLCLWQIIQFLHLIDFSNKFIYAFIQWYYSSLGLTLWSIILIVLETKNFGNNGKSNMIVRRSELRSKAFSGSPWSGSKALWSEGEGAKLIQCDAIRWEQLENWLFSSGYNF